MWYNMIVEGNRVFLFANRRPSPMVFTRSLDKNRQNIGDGLLRLGDAMRGIYAIVNKANGHRYVGSANNIGDRWSLHKHDLRRGRHHSVYLQRAWDKYGEDSFEFVVLREVEKKEDLIRNEQEFLDSLRPEYNILRVAGNSLGHRQSAEARRKMSIAKSGANHPRFGKPLPAEVREKISEGNKGKPKSAKHRQSISEYNKAHGVSVGSRNPMYGKSGRLNPRARSISQYSPDGELIATYETIAAAGIAVGHRPSQISDVLAGNRKTCGGFVWKYADQN